MKPADPPAAGRLRGLVRSSSRACVSTFPTNTIFLNEVYPTLNEDCRRCGMCVNVCPVGAIACPWLQAYTMK